MGTIVTFFSQALPLEEANIVILGAGKFGASAFLKLIKRFPLKSFTIVDKKVPGQFINLCYKNVRVIQGDAIAYLDENFQDILGSWVLPAVPIHVAYEWMTRRLNAGSFEIQTIPIPDEIRHKLPNVLVLEDQQNVIFTSFASFVCPDNCSEPADRCTFTGELRKGDLYEVIRNSIPASFNAFVFRSFQIAPGVGGYPFLHLWTALELITKRHMYLKPVFVATACKCHGVINGCMVRSQV